MKEQDFLNALGKVPQEMLDELAEWQESGAPLTELLPELDSADPAIETVTRPQMTQRRNKPMKQTQRQSERSVQMLPWKLGIGAAMTACLVAAVSVGREAISRQDSALQTGYSDIVSEISEQGTELIELEELRVYHGCEIPVSENGLVQVIRNMDDAATLLEGLSEELSDRYPINYYISADTLDTHDVLLMGYQVAQLPSYCWEIGYNDGVLTAEGSAALDFSILTVSGLPETTMGTTHTDPSLDNYYFFCLVPKDAVPEIADWEFRFTEYAIGELPEEIMENPYEEDDEADENKSRAYVHSQQVYEDYCASFEETRYLRKLRAKPEAYEAIAVSDAGKFSGDEIDVPADGLLQVIRSMDDAEPLIDVLSYEEDVAFTMDIYLTEEWLAAHDVILMGCQRDYFQARVWQYGYHDGTVSAEGAMHLEYSVLTMPVPDSRAETENKAYNYYYFFSVPKDALPELTELTLSFKEYSLGEQPEDVLTELFETAVSDASPEEYFSSNPVYQDYCASVEGQRCIRKLPAKQETPEETVEVVEMAALPEPMDAWYWERYRGTDIKIPAAGTVAVIRTLEDAEQYRTGSNYQTEHLKEVLSSAWLYGNDEHEAHDVIFIGMPANKMPDNTAFWDYHAGTVTPSGKLHLDFSVMTLVTMPEKLDYDSNTNFYYFISVPKGELPDITAWDVTFTEYRADASLDAKTLAANAARIKDKLHELPAYDNHLASVLCDKYINWAYDDDPNSIEAVGAVACNLDVPVSRSYGNIIEDADSGHTEAYFNYVCDTESKAYAGVADTLEGYRALRDALALGNLELVVDRSEPVDVLMLVLPVHDARAQTALTDMQISADGVLSLTMNEYYGTNNVDASQDTASVVWQIMVPHGSVPKITAVNLNRNLVEYVYSETDGNSLESDITFIKLAGRMITVQLTAEAGSPASAINTRQPEDAETVDIAGMMMYPTNYKGSVAAVMLRSEADLAALQASENIGPDLRELFVESDTYDYLFLVFKGASVMASGDWENVSVPEIKARNNRVYAEMMVMPADEAAEQSGQSVVCRMAVPKGSLPQLGLTPDFNLSTMPVDFAGDYTVRDIYPLAKTITTE